MFPSPANAHLTIRTGPQHHRLGLWEKSNSGDFWVREGSEDRPGSGKCPPARPEVSGTSRSERLTIRACDSGGVGPSATVFLVLESL